MPRLAALAIALVALATCGGSAPKRAATSAPEAAPAPAEPTDMTRADPAAEIRALEAEIGELRGRLGFAASTEGGAAEICAGLDECTDACNLADSICTNADKICEISKDVGDPWAIEKCEGAKSSCAEARELCTCCERKLGG